MIVPTLDRADALDRLLASLRRQTAPSFEVVVVNGPSTDHTDEVLRAWGHLVRPVRCPERNLSMSRNLGVAVAAGEIVVFVDDDAVCEPTWLAELLGGFDSPEVAAVGGVVFDHTGAVLQYEAMVSNRLGDARPTTPGGHNELRCFPGSWEIPYVPGGNAAYRRDALREIGGFDEAIAYYLDETDVCFRLVDAGYLLRQLDRAAIHHKNLPSGVRDARRVVRDWYPIFRSRAYFAFRHALEWRDATAIVAATRAHANHTLDVVRGWVDAGLVPADEPARAAAQIDAGIEDGMRAAAGPARHVAVPPAAATSFRAFATEAVVAADATVVVSSRPVTGAGDASIPAHELRVIHAVSPPDAAATPTVDLVDGVWRHDATAAGLAAEVARVARIRPVRWFLADRADDAALAAVRATSRPVLAVAVARGRSLLDEAAALDGTWCADATGPQVEWLGGFAPRALPDGAPGGLLCPYRRAVLRGVPAGPCTVVVGNRAPRGAVEADLLSVLRVDGAVRRSIPIRGTGLHRVTVEVPAGGAELELSCDHDGDHALVLAAVHHDPGAEASGDRVSARVAGAR